MATLIPGHDTTKTVAVTFGETTMNIVLPMNTMTHVVVTSGPEYDEYVATFDPRDMIKRLPPDVTPVAFIPATEIE